MLRAALRPLRLLLRPCSHACTSSPCAAAALAWRVAAPAALRVTRAGFAGGPKSRPWTHRAAVAAGDAWAGDALTVSPVGVFEGPFRTRNGTPRQGSLAPRARGTVRLLGDAMAGGAADALSGLEGFSHAILVFYFHANTAARAAAKVAPPRLGGTRVGVFATRAPHRPNAIGLSVVRVESVDGDLLHVSGADLLHGTPVLDIKPYCPAYDAHSSATVPDWLSGAPDTAPRTVRWSAAARAGLAAAAPRLRFLRSAEEAGAAIEDSLRSELRSAYRRNACPTDPYGFLIDVLDVRCLFDDAARAVEVTDVALCPYDAAAGDSGAPGGLAASDAALFRALLSPGGLGAVVNDSGAALLRCNGVLLGAPLPGLQPGQFAGLPATLRYDWRAGCLRASLPGGEARELPAEALRTATAKGYKQARALGLLLLAGPAPGGATGWLRPGAKLGVAALWDALNARPRLTPQQYLQWEAPEAPPAPGEDDTARDEDEVQ